MPPKDKNIHLGPGQLYINDEHFGDISEASLEGSEAPEALPETVHTSGLGEFSATLELTEEEAEIFREWERAAREFMAHTIAYHIALVLDACPNRRVAHLVRNGRKARTRKKNWRRAKRYFYGVKE